MYCLIHNPLSTQTQRSVGRKQTLSPTTRIILKVFTRSQLEKQRNMATEKQPLELKSVIGFGGKVPNGLIYHPDGIHMIYSLGSTVVVKNTQINKQAFLKGHSHQVSCLSLSHDGTKLASGQVTHMGFVADIILWDMNVAAAMAAGEDEGKLGDVLINRLG